MSRTTIARWAAVLLALTVGLVGWAPSASAHFADIVAETDCEGLVWFTAVSWMPGELNGENSHIDIAVSVDGGAYEVQPWNPDWYFGPDHWSFYALLPTVYPEGSVVTVQSRPAAKWSGLDSVGNITESSVTIPGSCTPAPCEEVVAPDDGVNAPDGETPVDDCETPVVPVDPPVTPPITTPTVQGVTETPVTPAATATPAAATPSTVTPTVQGATLASTGSAASLLSGSALVLLLLGGTFVVLASRKHRSTS